MKYTCDICSALFNDFDKCKLHEKECIKKHQTALYMAEDISFMPDKAKLANVELCVKVKLADNEFKYFNVINAEYAQKDKRVIINIDQNEQQQQSEQKPETKKSSKKS